MSTMGQLLTEDTSCIEISSDTYDYWRKKDISHTPDIRNESSKRYKIIFEQFHKQKHLVFIKYRRSSSSLDQGKFLVVVCKKDKYIQEVYTSRIDDRGLILYEYFAVPVM